MSCVTCGDKGVLKVWADSHEIAICLCPTGQIMRNTKNAGRETGYALWQLWCARQGVEPSSMFLLEEVLTPAELEAHGFAGTPRSPAEAVEAIVAAAQTKRGRL